MNRFLKHAIPLLFFVLGLGMIWFGMQGILTAHASKKWPIAMGTITQSELQESTSSGSSRSRTYHARIGYRYQVNQNPYTGTRIAIGDFGSSDPAHAERLVRKYPEGKAVGVRYDPEQAAESLLEPGVKTQAFLLPFMGSMFVLFGGIFWLFVFFKGVR
ncbi:MAG: DUF3592 domain-containing protein [Candidatus Sericytochromatia bacterium]|nr:DUF3592 domain-containing protein [Candidatus Sericytochromatia bacterium]